MMFYRERDTDSGRKHRSDQDDEDENEDIQNIKTTNFSISEILRPEFGQRIKPEASIPGSINPETFSAFSIVNSPTNYHHSLLNFDDIFRRYKTFMCSASSEDCDFTFAQHNYRGSVPQEKLQQEQAKSTTRQTPGTPDSENRINGNTALPAWVYCTRYSDRPSAGPRAKRPRHRSKPCPEDKRPRTAFTNEQLNILTKEFNECRYLTEKRRINLANDLNLSESQIKIWFQNKRAKAKKTSDAKNTLALNLIAEGLYNHSTVKGALKTATSE